MKAMAMLCASFAMAACGSHSTPMAGEQAPAARDRDDAHILVLGGKPYKDGAAGTLELGDRPESSAAGAAGAANISGAAGMSDGSTETPDAAVQDDDPAVDASAPREPECPYDDAADCDTLLATVVVGPVTTSLEPFDMPFPPQGRLGIEGSSIWLESMVVHGSTFEQSFVPANDAHVAGVARALEHDVWSPVASICASKCVISDPPDQVDLRGKRITRIVFALDTYSETPNGTLLDQTFGGRWEVRGY